MISFAPRGLVRGQGEAVDRSWKHSSQAVGSGSPLPTADARVAPWLPPAAAILFSAACRKCGPLLPKAQSTNQRFLHRLLINSAHGTRLRLAPTLSGEHPYRVLTVIPGHLSKLIQDHLLAGPIRC